jgi:hypothetical protein
VARATSSSFMRACLEVGGRKIHAGTDDICCPHTRHRPKHLQGTRAETARARAQKQPGHARRNRPGTRACPGAAAVLCHWSEHSIPLLMMAEVRDRSCDLVRRTKSLFRFGLVLKQQLMVPKIKFVCWGI